MSDFNGSLVSLSSDGSIVAIAASGADGNNGVDSGYVRIYQMAGLNFETGLYVVGKKLQGISRATVGDCRGIRASIASRGAIAPGK